MLEITNVKLSKNTVNAGEKYVISVDINEIIDYPYDFPYDFPVSCTSLFFKYSLSQSIG